MLFPESIDPDVAVVTVTRDGAIVGTLTVRRTHTQLAVQVAETVATTTAVVLGDSGQHASVIAVAETVRASESFLVGSPSHVTFTLEVTESDQARAVDRGGPSSSRVAPLASVLDTAGLRESIIVGFPPRVLFVREAASVDSSRISESTTVVRL